MIVHSSKNPIIIRESVTNKEMNEVKEIIEAVFPIISKEMKKINNLITDMPNSVDECLKRYKENYNDYYKGLIIRFSGDYPYVDEEWTDKEIDKYDQSLYDAMYRINNNKICNKYGTFFIDQVGTEKYWCFFDNKKYDPKEIEKFKSIYVKMKNGNLKNPIKNPIKIDYYKEKKDAVSYLIEKLSPITNFKTNGKEKELEDFYNGSKNEVIIPFDITSDIDGIKTGIKEIVSEINDDYKFYSSGFNISFSCIFKGKESFIKFKFKII